MTALLFAGAAPAARAVDLMSIGFLDQSAIEATTPFRRAAAQLQREKATLDAQYSQAMHATNDPAIQKQITAAFSQRFGQRQEVVLAPLYRRGAAALAEIAAAKGLSVVVDRRIIVVGGVDVTAAVIKRLANPQPIGHSHAALPPSSVGYVDEQQLNAVPQIKSVNERYAKAQHAIDLDATTRIQTAEGTAAREAIAAQAQKAQMAKQHELIDPLVTQMNTAMSRVADKDGLALVIDRAAILLGGRDVTAEVIRELQ